MSSEPLSAQTATAAAFICRPAAGDFDVRFFFFSSSFLTNNDTVVGSLVDGAIKLDDVTVAEDTEDFSLTHKQTHTRRKRGFVIILATSDSPSLRTGKVRY